MKLAALVFAIALVVPAYAQVTSQKKPVIEIYLLKKKITGDSIFSKVVSSYFLPDKNDITDTAFITDNEITGYVIIADSTNLIKNTSYTLLLANSAQQKINSLRQIPICCGLQFVIAINKTPVLGGYFWNPFSSFGCVWIAAYAEYRNGLVLRKGIGGWPWGKDKEDPRGNINLISAFRSTGRLIID